MGDENPRNRLSVLSSSHSDSGTRNPTISESEASNKGPGGLKLYPSPFPALSGEFETQVQGHPPPPKAALDS